VEKEVVACSAAQNGRAKCLSVHPTQHLRKLTTKIGCVPTDVVSGASRVGQRLIPNDLKEFKAREKPELTGCMV